MARVLLPGRGFYIWGGYANMRQLPAVLKAHELYFSQAIIWDKQHPVLTRKDFMGAPRVVLLRLEARGRPPSTSDPTTPPTCGHQEGQSPEDDPPDGEARRTGRAGDAVFLAGRRKRPGPVRRLRLDADRRRADRAQGVPDGTRPPYCDVIVERWEKFTGRKAERVGAVPPETKE